MSQQLDSDEVSRIGLYLFERFIDENEIPQEHRTRVTIPQFLQWLGSSAPSLYDVMGATNCAEANVQFVLNMPHEPTGPNQLFNLWPYLLLDYRKMEHELRSLQVFMTLLWEDGTIAPFSIFLHKDSVVGDLNDAAVAHTVMTRTQDLADHLMQQSLDELHNAHADSACKKAGETIDLIIEALNQSTAELSDEQSDRINGLLAFMSSMFPAQLPDRYIPPENKEEGVPDTLEQIEGKGGWDAPPDEEG
jgi:hypothetical protein